MFARLITRLQSLGAPRLVVLGDLMLDRYVWGRVDRISPEAPIPVLKVTGERDLRPGGAANVAVNLRALGAEVALVGTVGADAAGRELVRLARRAGVRTAGLLVDRAKPTPVKTRMIAHHQQILRIDEEETAPIAPRLAARLRAAARREIARADLVLISDYGKGTLPAALLAAVFTAARARGLPALADPKGSDYARYRGATALTPNLVEAAHASRVEIHDAAGLRRAARRLLAGVRLDFLVITRGEQGMTLFDAAGGETHVPARARAVYDVTGAGDTALAMLGLALAAGAPRDEALHLANLAAGIVVGKLGTATVTRAELLAHLAAEHHGTSPKVLPAAQLAQALAARRRRGERIVFTNGCFDLLHAGHVQSLRFARSHGDALVVGINTDRSVRRLKGEGRPLLPERERAQVLAALADVDYVTLFDEDTPERLIRRVRPDVLVKGRDWAGKGVVGQAFVKSYGGRVELAPLAPGLSTSALVERIRAGAVVRAANARGGRR